ncbi:HNH endonuclease [Streptomyces sp. NPDC088730]|uniref:HNH endonuclease n=1 Tax=Streptomyces sp. NPDC088730 TaxID=3365877 RepID=UPI0037F58775
MAEWGVDISHFATGRIRHSETRLREVVSQSVTLKEVLRRLDISPVGGNQTHISRRIRALNIDTTHFSAPPRRPKGQPGGLLVLSTPMAGRTPGKRLRRELIRIGVEERCAVCGTGTVWNDLPLRLEVDHRNGDWWDNRPDNLRLLCPNCHAITDTYRGRKRSSTS